MRHVIAAYYTIKERASPAVGNGAHLVIQDNTVGAVCKAADICRIHRSNKLNADCWFYCTEFTSQVITCIFSDLVDGWPASAGVIDRGCYASPWLVQQEVPHLNLLVSRRQFTKCDFTHYRTVDTQGST